MATSPSRTVHVDVHLGPADLASALREDARRGLTSEPKALPPKWFYDERGSLLFDEITRLPEYYLTDRERDLLREHAHEIAELTSANTLVELGSGTSEKTRLLMDALAEAGHLRRFMPFDVSEETLRASAAAIVGEHKRELTKLDSAIGDADHGENLDRGFRAALERLPDPDSATPGDILKAVAMALISKVGGAAGPLYGTAFLRAASAVEGRSELDDDAVVAALGAALEGVKMRGKAEPGDKTMVDALTPAIEAARAAVDAGDSLQAALRAAAAAAEQGMHDTVPLVARKGRASYLGERSAGHQDPGATSTYLLLKTMAEQEDCN
jgi:phosphoenolpyruvate---glycerone phosphotransferase subunit DhaL